jgi:3-oxoadipate enol-lactonase
MIVSTPAEGYAACCEALAAMDLRGDLAAIDAPTLVVAGADDPSTPPDHAERIAAGVDGARVVVLDDARHLASVERSDEVTDLILRHAEEAR